MNKKFKCRVTHYFYYFGKDYYEGDIVEVDDEFYNRWKAYLEKLKPEKVKPKPEPKPENEIPDTGGK